MPTEKSRKTKIKKVRNPDSDDQFVPVPVITQLTLRDQKSFGQDHVIGFDNSDKNKGRKVHTISGKTKDDTSWPDGSRLDVERIDQFAVRDQKSFGQDFIYILNNKEDDEKGPGPHLKTHFRYWTQPPEAALPDPTVEPTGADAWLKMQVIDKIDPTDQKSFGQGHVLILDNPKDGSDIPTGDDVDAAEDSNSDAIDPPWRFDPFQNVVDVSWGTAGCVNSFSPGDWDGTKKAGSGLAEVRDGSGKLVQSIKNDEGYYLGRCSLSPGNKLIALGLTWSEPRSIPDPTMPVPAGTKIIRVYDRKGAQKASFVADENDTATFTDTGDPIYLDYESLYYLAPIVHFGGDGDLFTLAWKVKLRDDGDHTGVVEKYIDIGFAAGGTGALTTKRFTSVNNDPAQIPRGVSSWASYTGGITGVDLGIGFYNAHGGGAVITGFPLGHALISGAGIEFGDAANGGVLLSVFTKNDDETNTQGYAYWIDKSLNLVKKFGDTTVGQLLAQSNMSSNGDVPFLHGAPTDTSPRGRVTFFDKDNSKKWTSPLYDAGVTVTGDFRRNGSYVILANFNKVESWGPAKDPDNDDFSHEKLWSLTLDWSASKIIALGNGVLFLSNNSKFEVYGTIPDPDNPGKFKSKKTQSGSDVLSFSGSTGITGAHTSSSIKLQTE